MKKSIITYLASSLLLSACSAAGQPNQPVKKSRNTLQGYLEERNQFDVDLSLNSGSAIDMIYKDETNEEVREKADCIVYAEVNYGSYFMDDLPYSIVELNVLNSLGPNEAPQTLYLATDQCILPAREATADPEEAARAAEAHEKDPENNWFPDEDEFFIQIMPNDRFYTIGDRYVLLLKEKKSESDDEQILYNTVSGTYGSFLEVADDQFVNVGRISSSTQTMSLKVQEIPASAISVYAEFVTLEDFAEFAQGGELPASIVYEDVIVQKLE